MRTVHRLLASVIALATAVPATAQVINLRTVPVAAGDQFFIFPSDHLALGGVRIALADPWLDPFVNPAKGSQVAEPLVFTAPTFYTIGRSAGSAATLSAGTLVGGGSVFGGALLALQQIKSGQEFFGPWPTWDRAILPPDALSERSATNKYGFLTLGTRLPGRAAVGVSGLFADLNAIDGVEHLYAMATNIDQSGSLADVRLGATKELGEGALLEAVGVYNRFAATHDVRYVDWVLDSTDYQWEMRERLEVNRDRTETWGLHLGFRRPVGTQGWTVGGILTGNYKNHPAIPNYELVNIPRDPGHSTALDLGVGVAKQTGPVTLGMDLVYEPAWSSTWALAASATTTSGGDTIPAGGRTVENEFQFSNAYVNVGGGYAVGVATFQLGLQVRAYDYHLDQWNNVEKTSRRQNEQWMEWVPSWGLRISLKGVELRYLGRVTTGTGLPGVAWGGAAADRAESFAAANDIVVPPGGPLTLQDADVWTHQLSVAVPLR